MNTIEEKSRDSKHLDLLVIGTSHDILYKEIMEDFPHFNALYIDAEHSSIEAIGDTFITLNAKRTLIFGELSKSSGKSGEANLLIIKSLLELKKPEQKILLAAYFEFSSALKHLKTYHLRLPSSPKKIMQKFDEMK